MYAAIVLVVALGLFGLCQRLHRTRHFYQYLFFCRVPLLIGIVVVGLPLFAITAARGVIGNWFASVGFGDAAIMAFALLLTARVLCYLVQVVFQVMPARALLGYPRGGEQGERAEGEAARDDGNGQHAGAADERRDRVPAVVDWPQWNIRIAMLFPIATWSSVILVQSEHLGRCLLGFLAGGGLFGVLLLAFQSEFANAWFDRLTRADDDTARARRRAGVFFLLFLGLFGLGAWLGRPGGGSPELIPLPVYPLLIVTILALILTWLTARLDSRRVPVMLVATAWPLFFYSACHSDHEYELREPDPKIVAAASPQGLDEAAFVRGWMTAGARPWVAHGRPRIPIVVTASGGGITAAYWTACVLDRLCRDPDFGAVFAPSVLLTSSVSGGSAGFAFWLQEYANGGVAPEASDRAAGRAGTECLSSISWGLAYPDLMRLFMPWFTPTNLDRGAALEAAWLATGMDAEATLWSWRQQAALGLRPTSIFNATIVETGQRLMIALHDVKVPELVDGASAQAWLRLYPGWDLRIATAARLSATFPFVSPVARPVWKGAADGAPQLLPTARYHVADGGYYDNDGVASALEFLATSRQALRESQVERLLLVRIRASPVGEMPDAKDDSGWASAFLGPLQTMLKVRTASQVDRNRTQLAAMIEAWKPELEILDVAFELKTSDTLSWYLTDGEQRGIRGAVATNAAEIGSIAQFLGNQRVEQAEIK